jgi:uncharacterized protein YjbI with pentapeptide repeats
MVREQRWRWGKTRKFLLLIISIALVVGGLVGLILVAYSFNWTGFNGYRKIWIATTTGRTSPRTITETQEYQPGKMLWDWLQLLITPVAFVVGIYAFQLTTSRNERKGIQLREQTEREIATDNQHELALQVYTDNIAELLLERQLRESGSDAEVRRIAQVQTLAVLPRLDERRKACVLQFLYEAGLITKGQGVISLQGADLRGADLSNAKLHDTDLRGIDLLGADLQKASLDRADLRGANLSLANLSRARLREATLWGADLREATLWGVNLDRADLRGANLSLANLSRAGLREATLWGANLREADLHEADLYEVDLHEADLRETDLTRASLIRANLREASLWEARLRGADLSEANLRGADLRGAKLESVERSETKLMKADLSAARLAWADLSGAKLDGAVVTPEQLQEAKSIKQATMPDGSIHHKRKLKTRRRNKRAGPV